MRKQFFFSETNLFKESMKKFVCIVNERKTANNELENDGFDFLRVLYRVYKKLVSLFFHTYSLHV